MQNTAPFPAFKRLKQQLVDSGISDESAAFIIGRLVSTITESVMAELAGIFASLSPEEQEKLNKAGDDVAKQQEISRVFQEKKGKSLDDFRDELAEKLVADFEAAG